MGNAQRRTGRDAGRLQRDVHYRLRQERPTKDELIQLLNVQQLATRAVTFIPEAIAALIIFAAFWVVYRLTRFPLTAILQRAGIHATLVSMVIDNVYRGIVLLFGLIMAADQIGINVRAALAGLGVVGIAVGFAAQDSLSNIIAGFLIFMDKPFTGGDWVKVAGQYGKVSEITMRTTRIRTNNNTYVVIPNKTIINEVLVNHSKHGETRVDVPVGIAYKERIPAARAVILEAVGHLDGLARFPPPDLVVTELGGSSVNLKIRVWIEDAAVEEGTFYRVMEASKIALDEAGIQIPYPHLQLFVDSVEDRVWQQAARLAGAS